MRVVGPKRRIKRALREKTASGEPGCRSTVVEGRNQRRIREVIVLRLELEERIGDGH